MICYKFVQLFAKALIRAVSMVRGCWLLLFVRLCGGTCDGIPRVGAGLILKYPPHKGWKIGRNCDIGPYCYFDVPPGGVFTIGKSVKLTSNVVVSAINNVELSDNVLIAEFVSIRDSQHIYEAGQLVRTQGLELGSIYIGEDVWIGCSSSIFMGTIAERGSVVGASSLVKNIRLEENSVYVGCPVKKITERKVSR